MRITADIIDEEIAFDSTSADKVVQTEAIERRNILKIDKNKHFALPAEIGAQRLYTGKCVKPKVLDSMKCGNYESWLKYSTLEKEKRNKPKYKYDWYKSKNSKNVYTHSSCKVQALRMQDLNNKFKELKVSGDLNSYKKMKESCDHWRQAPIFPWYKMDETKANCSKAVKAMEKETPPEWLVTFLQKMKQEIKEEVLEELSGYPQFENQKNEDSEQHSVIHQGVFCDNCDQNIRGIRYKCGNCPDFDLCAECESLPDSHYRNHVLLKIRCPVDLRRLYHEKRGKALIISNVGDSVGAVPKKTGHPHKRLYESRFLYDENVPDGSIFAPSARFMKSWRILNSGKRVWTHATKLKMVGTTGLIPDSVQVDLPHLRPGEEGTVSVWFCSPADPGVYKSSWNFTHKNIPFGPEVWCHIVVRSAKSDNLVETLQLPSDGLPDVKEQEVETITQVLTAVRKEHELGNMIPRKLAVNSHTATPTNTPFDLTPPKSPDHHAISELREVAEDRESNSSNQNADVDAEEEEEGSVVSLSSSESEAEYVVIPMPKCFNLSESFSSQHIPSLSQYLPPETVANIKNLSISEHKLMTTSKAATFSGETVSQETGVPELSSHGDIEQKIIISHTSADGSSSSEVSVIESGGSSPTEEHTLAEIHVAVTSTPKPISPQISVDNGNVQKVAETETQELTSDAQPSSSTFPKFPVEGIANSVTNIYEAVSNKPEQSEQKPVQVLPERLVTAPLNAAASLFQTACGVISSLQHPARSNPGAGALLNPMDQLTEMGFCNRQQNEELLRKHKNDIAQVVAELVSLNDNDWYASRHNPPSPPDFFD